MDESYGTHDQERMDIDNIQFGFTPDKGTINATLNFIVRQFQNGKEKEAESC